MPCGETYAGLNFQRTTVSNYRRRGKGRREEGGGGRRRIREISLLS